MKRTFRSIKDLRVPKKVQAVLATPDILPVAFDGRQLNTDRLLELGEQVARARGELRPTVEEKIRLGIYACAKESSLELRPQEVRRLIRHALFDSEKAPCDCRSEVLEQVKIRSALALQRHLEEPLDETYRWFWGPRNTFLTQICKGTKQHGAAPNREESFAALIELGWQGFGMLADCLEVLMRSFAASLPEGLVQSQNDRAVNELLYFRQQRLGGLPLVLLKSLQLPWHCV